MQKIQLFMTTTSPVSCQRLVHSWLTHAKCFAGAERGSGDFQQPAWARQGCGCHGRKRCKFLAGSTQRCPLQACHCSAGQGDCCLKYLFEFFLHLMPLSAIICLKHHWKAALAGGLKVLSSNARLIAVAYYSLWTYI